MKYFVCLFALVAAAGAAIKPENVTLKAGQSVQLSVTGPVPCTNWFLWKTYNGIPSIGTLSPAGLYRAPDVIHSNQIVVADCGNLYEDDTIQLIASSDIIGVTISPSAVKLGAGQSQQFAAAVSTTAGSALSFSVSRSGELAAAQIVPIENHTGNIQTVFATPSVSPIVNHEGAVPCWLGVRGSSHGIEVFIVHTNLKPGSYEGEIVLTGEQTRRYPVFLRIGP